MGLSFVMNDPKYRHRCVSNTYSGGVGLKDNLCFALPTIAQLVKDADGYCQLIEYLLHQPKMRISLLYKLREQCQHVTALSCCNAGVRFLSLYLNIKVYHSLSLLNSQLAQSRKSKNRKLLKLANLKLCNVLPTIRSSFLLVTYIYGRCDCG